MRTGLHGAVAGRSIAHLHSLLGSRGVILANLKGVLASEGIDSVHRELLDSALARVLTSGHPQVLGGKHLICPTGPRMRTAGRLVALREIRELRTDGSQTTVRIGQHELQVSRRDAHELRDRLFRNARSNGR